MKKYISQSTKVLAIISLLSASALIAGIILFVVKNPNVALALVLTMLGGFLTILFVASTFAERSRFVAIDLDEISLPRGTEINGKTVFQRTRVKLSEIAALESKQHKGVFLITEDACFYTLKLNDDVKITFTLYAYGKQAEKEIIEVIKDSIK